MSTHYYRRSNTYYGNNRSNYCGCGCDNDPVIVEEKKESSATAKTALGLAIGGLGLAAVNGGLFGGAGECGGGGLLGGLFGNRNGASCEQLARGRQAQTELAIVHQYFMPTWYEISDLKKQVAVNKAVEEKNNEITHLLFKRSEENTAAGFELNKLRTEAAFALAEQKSQCCCDKTNAKIDAVSNLERMRTEAAFALADQKQECCCDRLDTRITCEADKAAASLACNVNNLDTKIDALYGGLSAKTDYKFTISNLETDAKLCDATRNLVRGEVYLSPASLADPYRAGTNVLLSRHINGCGTGSTTFNNDCGGCSGWFNW